MKLLWVFALYGITCCLAGPTCSRDELYKCPRGPPGQPGTEEEELDIICRQTACWVEIYDRCGTAVFGERPIPRKGYQKVLDSVCGKSSPLNRKYLENVGCMRSLMDSDDLKRHLKMCGVPEKPIPGDDYCMTIADGFSCAIDYITRKCGKDAGEVFRVAALPLFDPYDCLSS